MALFVPALRMTMLFLNVYESYKTLKPPPPSARDPTRPSVRALTQRKRDMKGCLAVWIVYCCFTSYERMVESLISMFIPFYDEFKSMFILFLIFTRARGAEPLFLHIIRPIIKPYTSTLDGTLDLLRMTGDFLFALSAYPVHMAIAWWHRRSMPASDTNDSDSDSTTSSSLRTTATENTAHSRDAAQHERWIPPQSAYNEEEEVQEDVDAPPEIVELTQEEKAVDEWRQYPAFPSAYPTSPLLTTSFFPPTAPSFASAMSTQGQRGSSMYSAGARPSDPQQGFHGSLLSSGNPLNPGYARGSSDQTKVPLGFMPTSTISTSSSTTYQPSQVFSDDEDRHGNYMEEDDPHDNMFSGSGSEASDDDEDIYNMTLRTPLPPHGAARSRALMERLTIPLPLGSANSMNSQSTAVQSAQTTASTFRTWSSRGSDPDSLDPSPVDGAGLLFASSATLVAGTSPTLGLVIGEDMEKTLVERQPRRQQSGGQIAKKRKAGNKAGLQDLTETSDGGDDDEVEVEMDEEDSDHQEGEYADEDDVYVPSEQQTRPEVKRRKIVGKPSEAAMSTSLKPTTQPRGNFRKPLAARQPQTQIGESGASTASQQAAKAQSKPSVAKVKTDSNVTKGTQSSLAPAAKKNGNPATRFARPGAMPASSIAKAISGSTVKGKGGLKKGAASSAASSTANLAAPSIAKTASSGSTSSNASSSIRAAL